MADQQIPRPSNGMRRLMLAVAASVAVPLLIQSGALVWWASNLTTRINYVERDLERCSQRVYALEVR